MDSGTMQLLAPAMSDDRVVDRQRPHYRECRRRTVDIPAEVRLCAPDGSTLDTGSARVANISASGALLADFRLQNGTIPVGPSVLHVTMRGESFDGVTMRCRPVRHALDCSGLGVRIEDILVSLEGGARRRRLGARKRA